MSDPSLVQWIGVALIEKSGSDDGEGLVIWDHRSRNTADGQPPAPECENSMSDASLVQRIGEAEIGDRDLMMKGMVIRDHRSGNTAELSPISSMRNYSGKGLSELFPVVNTRTTSPTWIP